MEPLGEQIRAELRRIGADSGTETIVNARGRPRSARRSRATRGRRGRRRDGTLVVHVRDAIWGFELTQRAARSPTGCPAGPRLRFVPGPLPDTAPEPAPAPPAEATPRAGARGRRRSPRESRIRDLRESVAKAIKAALVRAPADRSV